MNCKPNDLAMVVRATPEGHLQELSGRVFRVTQLVPMPANPIPGDLPSWGYEGEAPVVDYKGILCTVNALPDYILQPLRNEPDTDEVTTDRTIDEGVTA